MMFQSLAAVGPGLRDSLFRGNRVIPVALGALVVLVLFWIVVGFFLGGKDDESVSNRAFVSQSPNELAQQSGSTGAPSPEVEIRNAESYAAYQSKDPFRELIPSADSESATTGGDGLSNNGTSSGSSTPPAGGAGGGGSTSFSTSPSSSSVNGGGGTSTPFSTSPSPTRSPSFSTNPTPSGSAAGGTGGNGSRGGNGAAGSGGGGRGGNDNLFDSGGSLPY